MHRKRLNSTMPVPKLTASVAAGSSGVLVLLCLALPEAIAIVPQQANGVRPTLYQSLRAPLELVVKFKHDAEVKAIVDLYRKDAAAARRRFDLFKAGRPELAETVLRRATYSDELVLELAGQGSSDLSVMQALARRLATVAGIAYAEVDATAHADHDGRADR